MPNKRNCRRRDNITAREPTTEPPIYESDDMPNDINFCQRCGEPLSKKRIDGRMRPVCPACGFIVFLDPKVAVVILNADADGLLMVKRGVEPHLGKWAFPSGYVDRGEVVEHAAIREMKEETGLDVALDALIGVYSLQDSPVILIVYAAHAIGGALAPGHDAQDAKRIPLDALPPLPFPHDAQILADWQTALNNG